MSRSAASPASAGRPRESPLRLATLGEPSLTPHRTGHLSPPQLRLMMIGEFEQWLRSCINKEKRPFQEETVLAYAKAARALDTWMTNHHVDGNFTACDTALLNRFFRDYHDAHTRGGTNTKQRDLRHLFTWLEADYDHPHPYTDELSRWRSSPTTTRASSTESTRSRRSPKPPTTTRTPGCPRPGRHSRRLGFPGSCRDDRTRFSRRGRTSPHRSSTTSWHATNVVDNREEERLLAAEVVVDRLSQRST
jgi:hypothetical protein